jgi:predicted RNase H-like HicB family nuclease
MAEYVYPAIFHTNEDGSFTVTYPDLPGCITEGKSLANAIYMAQSALTQWLEYIIDKKQFIPSASNLKSIEITSEEFVNFIRVDVKDNRAVKRTVSIPKWLDDKAIEAGLSLSRVLQDALKDRLNV